MTNIDFMRNEMTNEIEKYFEGNDNEFTEENLEKFVSELIKRYFIRIMITSKNDKIKNRCIECLKFVDIIYG